jgi:O-antigen ligase
MTSFLDKLSFAAVFVVMSLMPVMSHAGGLGVAPLVFILGAIGLFLAVKTKAVSITRTQIILTIFLVWLCLTSLWSPYKPDDVLTNYIKLAIMVGVFYWGRVLFEYTARHHQQRLQHLFMATSFFAVGLLVIDLLSNFGLTFLFNPVSNYDEAIFRMIDAEMNLGHSITILLLIAAPVALLMRACLPTKLARPVMVLFLSLLAIAAWLNGLAVGLVGLIFVTVAVIAGYLYPRIMPRALLSFGIAAILFAPLLAFLASNYVEIGETDLPQSWDHRLRMWGYCWDVITEHPIWGNGFDASRTFSETFIARDGREIVTVSLHPHNAGIQIWTETGIIGAVLASTVIFSLFKPVQNYAQSRAHAGAVSGVITATIIVSSLTYGAWQFWWWASVFFAIGTLYLFPNSKGSVALQDIQ